ncbi:thioredoxin domain-containing protein [Qipengyuania sp. ASV99]|uniref:thioredoxin domain-containing protein n=1 Tax=Qipengyuania sp. ASV99 TaxID=3399681 RepID=UPI003A4C50C4
MRKAFLGTLVAVAALVTPASAQTSRNDSDSPNGLNNPGSEFVGDGRRAAWHAEVERTDRGYRIGNPEADAALIEFISYTCGHCATFAREGEGALDLALLAPGHLNLEIRPVIRNAIDLTVSLLVACGPVDGFKNRHRMYLMRQDSWMEKARTAPQAQQAIWARGDRDARLNAARALDLDDMLAERGTSMADINTCLADDAAALALIRNGNADRDEFAVPGTPSFALDGELLNEVHTWGALYPVLAERFRPENASE